MLAPLLLCIAGAYASAMPINLIFAEMADTSAELYQNVSAYDVCMYLAIGVDQQVVKNNATYYMYTYTEPSTGNVFTLAKTIDGVSNITDMSPAVPAQFDAVPNFEPELCKGMTDDKLSDIYTSTAGKSLSTWNSWTGNNVVKKTDDPNEKGSASSYDSTESSAVSEGNPFIQIDDAINVYCDSQGQSCRKRWPA